MLQATSLARIQVPDQPDGAVERYALIDRVLGGPAADESVLVVCAAAGYGKTTFLLQWAQHRRLAGASIAWLTWGSSDDDPTRHFENVRNALALALDRTAPEASARLLDLGTPTSETLAVAQAELTLILDDAAEPLVLVIDDLPATGPDECWALVESLATRRPNGLQLALAARTLPPRLLTTLRLKVRLVEVGTADLALSPTEVAAVIAQAGADPAGITDPLLSQTEGWPAAVRLGVLAARSGHHGDGLTVPLSFDPSVSDYLSREILAALSPEAIEVLRATAVVGEISPGLAASLSGRPDSGRILESLFHAQALVRRVGSTAHRYVVHGLLRAYLLHELGAGDVSAPARQHAMAAAWLTDHGQADRALEHAMAARDPALTARLLHAVGLRLVLSGEVRRVSEGLDLIGTGQWDDDLIGLAALSRAEAGEVPSARAILDLRPVDETAGAQADDAIPGTLRIAQFCVRRLEGRPDDPALAASFRDVLGWRADPDPPVEHLDRILLLLVNRGQWRFATGLLEASGADLQLAQTLASRHRRDAIELRCMGTLCGMPVMEGDCATTARYVDEVLDTIERRGWSTHPAMADVYSAGAWAASMMLLPARAEQLIGRARDCLRGNADPEYASYAALIGAMLSAERPGDPTPALKTLGRLARSGPVAEVNPTTRAFAGMQRVRIQMRRGDLVAAGAALDDLARWLPGSAEPYVGRALIHAAQGHWAECLDWLRRSEGHVVTMPASEVVRPLLTAMADVQLGRGPASWAALQGALDVARPRDSVRPFYDAGPGARALLAEHRGRYGRNEEFVATILQRWDDADQLSTDAGVPEVDLTPRERDVLGELASLMTVEEIAAAMVLSVNTIRTHMRGLYRKLGVNTRRSAVRRGRDLGLL